jgi:hypothetical protein
MRDVRAFPRSAAGPAAAACPAATAAAAAAAARTTCSTTTSSSSAAAAAAAATAVTRRVAVEDVFHALLVHVLECGREGIVVQVRQPVAAAVSGRLARG